ncbi:hypothetical protein LQ327_27800 [Actinomycetospora endophytica]|uniref:Uncharacterized protein n=1 Tax=Actinomycetospora endophytica TaxID=2291215 RepID=A0ABS8PFY3_9PSEU|nr:hypothetical protein [Actinomycetospora endophytica]MCD2197181.1 hypothetical protein [Actinomycetospora endophytica]
MRTVSGSVGAPAASSRRGADGPERLTGDGALDAASRSVGAVSSFGDVRDEAIAAPTAAAPTAAAPAAAAGPAVES